MNRVFLDTGYLIALELEDDQHHETALRHWSELGSRVPELVTTTYVFDEVVTFFNSRGHHEKAVEIGRSLLESPRVTLVRVDSVLFDRGWRYFQSRPDKRFSLTDCISFVVMGEQGFTDAFSFDGHFEQAGFRRMP